MNGRGTVRKSLAREHYVKMMFIESCAKRRQQTSNTLATVVLNIDDVFHRVEFADVQGLLKAIQSDVNHFCPVEMELPTGSDTLESM